MLDSSSPTIFVSIASYSDPMLPYTIDDCIAKARYPQNLKFGICWQYDPAAPINLDRFKSDPRFRFMECTIEESEGGSWARNKAQQLWHGETYTLQVDSHMAFANCWDSSLAEMMHSFPADKPLITMIAPLFKRTADAKLRDVAYQGIRGTKVSGWTSATGWAPWFDWGARVSGRVVRNRFLSGQFVFTLGKWNEEVRQDPQHYYWGEEFALTLRSYTHGYDFFLPDEVVVRHIYHDEPPRRHWEHGDDVVAEKNKTAFNRLEILAFSNKPEARQLLGRYGLGEVRTIEDFQRFCGMDLAQKRIHPDALAGRAPAPITIKTESDWDRCVKFGDH